MVAEEIGQWIGSKGNSRHVCTITSGNFPQYRLPLWFNIVSSCPVLTRQG